MGWSLGCTEGVADGGDVGKTDHGFDVGISEGVTDGAADGMIPAMELPLVRLKAPLMAQPTVWSLALFTALLNGQRFLREQMYIGIVVHLHFFRQLAAR